MGSVGAKSTAVQPPRQYDGTVKLQGIPGPSEAYKVENLRVGDITLWNYGYTSVVTNIERKGAKSFIVTSRSSSDGVERDRTFREGRLIAVTNKEYKGR